MIYVAPLAVHLRIVEGHVATACSAGSVAISFGTTYEVRLGSGVVATLYMAVVLQFVYLAKFGQLLVGTAQILLGVEAYDVP